MKREEALHQATNEKEVDEAEKALRQEMEQALEGVTDAIKEATNEIINNKPKEVIERIEKDKEERKKASVEDEVRAHLRGFARTIPSFIMAYDEGSLALDNFDKNIEDEVFTYATVSANTTAARSDHRILIPLWLLRCLPAASPPHAKGSAPVRQYPNWQKNIFCICN